MALRHHSWASLAKAAALVVVAALPLEARATYSILAYDRSSGTFGGAVASCVPLETVELVYGATAPDASVRGAVITQSYLLDGANDDAVDALTSGTSASAVLGALTDPAYDPSFALRQYAVVDASGAVEAFTGDDAMSVAAHLTFEVGPFVGSVQGNILTDEDVVRLARDAFEGAEDCGLGERLMRALEAGGQGQHGDARCIAFGKPALSATLSIDAPDVLPLRLGVATSEDDGQNPVALLRASVDATHADACEPPEPPPGEGGGGGGSDDDDEPDAEPHAGCSTSLASAPTRSGLVVAALIALMATWRAPRTRGSWPRSLLRESCS